jgi:hypothetical protein
MGAHDRLPGLETVGFWLGKPEAVAQLDQGTDGIEPHFAVGIDKAKRPHLHEPGGEHVLQEAPDKLYDLEGHGPPPGAFGGLVAKGDSSIFDLENTAVGDSHPENIGSEILEAGGAFAHRPAVDVPLDFPHLKGDLPFEAGRLHLVSELGPEDFG